ncbi:MAG: LemA family protein [Patescibacteria group bacterium]|jgi:LemA protein
MSALYVILAIIGIIIISFVMIYNGLVLLKNRTDEAWSDIDVQLTRRHDLIPNLIETVKGYAKHEKEVFEKVTEARTTAISAQTPQTKAAAENMLTDALKSVFAVAEAYPDLKASENFLSLQNELTDTENKIEAARRFYNGNVRDLNVKIEQFPSSVIASMLKFAKREMFETANASDREKPEVKF